jgi:alanine dehydrogenase
MRALACNVLRIARSIGSRLLIRRAFEKEGNQRNNSPKRRGGQIFFARTLRAAGVLILGSTTTHGKWAKMRGTLMRVGCPKEIKNHEYRVGLTPAAVREYVAHGHEVWIETKAGAGIGADDASYIAAGAKIATAAKDIFEKCDMIVKVKEPQPAEWAQLREGQLLYTYLHLAPDPEQTKGLLASGVTAIAYETVTDDRGGLPLLAPMSEVAGRLSIQAGATALQKANGGLGILLGGVPGVLPA